MLDTLIWVLAAIAGVCANVAYALTHPMQWLNWSDSQALARFIYYGGSLELLLALVMVFALLTALGVWRQAFMWGLVRGAEGFSNGLGRLAAWAGLVMVFQQVMIVFLQRIFRVSEITLGPASPFGYPLWTGFPGVTFDLSWWSEELKLYNAMVVCLCAGYTFVQGGHVRVDLVYAAVSHRTKRMIDMAGSVLFIIPAMTLTWMYAWYFMWRHLVTPKISASDSLDTIMRKAAILKWNVETIGFSPNGFNAYFLFKILIVLFCFTMLVQGMAFFWRSVLEWRQGPDSANRYLDKDPVAAATVAEHTTSTHTQGADR